MEKLARGHKSSGATCVLTGSDGFERRSLQSRTEVISMAEALAGVCASCPITTVHASNQQARLRGRASSSPKI